VTIIASVGDNKNYPIVLDLNEFNGRKFLDVRRYYLNKTTGELEPTRKGIALTADTFFLVKKLFVEHEKDIENWLLDSNGVGRAQIDQENAKLVGRYKSKEHAREEKTWASPNFFNVVAEGNVEKITYNKKHKFLRVLRCISDDLVNAKTHDEREKHIDKLESLIAVTLMSFVRAKHLFEDSKAFNYQIVFDTLEYNWGIFLGNCIDLNKEIKQ
jgi:hypothetical protein